MIDKKILWYDQNKESDTYKKYIRGTIIQDNINQKGKKVYGEIKIYKERFIHLDAKLRFSKKTNDLEESTMPPKLQNFQTMLDSNKEINVDESSNEDYWIDTIFNTVRLNFKYIEELIYSEEEIMKEENGTLRSSYQVS